MNYFASQVSTKNAFHRDIGGFNSERFYLKRGELQVILTSNNRRQPCGKDKNKNVTSIITIQCDASVGMSYDNFF